MKKAFVEDNLKLLRGYPYHYGFTDEIIMNVANATDINQVPVERKHLHENDKIFAVNVFDIDYILEIEQQTYKKTFFSWKKMPIYLFYDDIACMTKLFQSERFSELLSSNRIVFIYQKGALRKYFEDYQSVLPMVFIGEHSEKYIEYFESLRKRRKKELEKMREETQEYYRKHADEIIENIKNKKYKILFLSTRFIGYVLVNDMYQGSVKAGYNTYLSIEKNDISRIYYEVDIARVKPDIIFVANIFRFDTEFIPPNVVVVSWLIDYRFPNIANDNAPKKLCRRDVLCNSAIGDKEFFERYHYKTEEFIDLSMNVANGEIFKKYPESELNKSHYCDIAYVSNNTDYRKMVDDFYKEFDNEFINIMRLISDEYFELEKREKPIYDFSQVRMFLADELYKRGVILSAKSFEDVYLKFLTVRYAIRKYVLALWLIEKKKYNIKFFGMNWENMEEFKRYSGGFPRTGEEVAKIYNSCKIVIAFHPDGTFPIKVVEVLLSESLPIVERIPAQFDLLPCKEYLEMDKDIIGYVGKEELYEKVDYYLEHEEKRKEVIARGKEKMNCLAPENRIKSVLYEVEKERRRIFYRHKERVI